ncbi:MAG: hypothetical protein ACJ72U_08345 [Nitrososphaeraceae archaeon]
MRFKIIQFVLLVRSCHYEVIYAIGSLAYEYISSPCVNNNNNNNLDEP